jgi:putative solute:sodium symporter small subunit
MENSANGYHISFFKPTTPQARANRNMIVWLVSIWFIAIFGFHILLKLVEKPTPEPSLIIFENAWNNLEKGIVADEYLKDLAKSTLSVLGKIEVSAENKAVLGEALSNALYELQSVEDRDLLLQEIRMFEEIKANITDIKNEEYISLRNDISNKFAPFLDLSPYDIRIKIIPYEISSASFNELNIASLSDLPVIMKKYLTHNQSFLTDFKFLGFPFHYFYTAVFLLILFVGLCWIYCVKIDSLNKRLEIAD